MLSWIIITIHHSLLTYKSSFGLTRTSGLSRLPLAKQMQKGNNTKYHCRCKEYGHPPYAHLQLTISVCPSPASPPEAEAKTIYIDGFDSELSGQVILFGAG